MSSAQRRDLAFHAWTLHRWTIAASGPNHRPLRCDARCASQSRARHRAICTAKGLAGEQTGKVPRSPLNGAARVAIEITLSEKAGLTVAACPKRADYGESAARLCPVEQLHRLRQSPNGGFLRAFRRFRGFQRLAQIISCSIHSLRSRPRRVAVCRKNNKLTAVAVGRSGIMCGWRGRIGRAAHCQWWASVDLARWAKIRARNRPASTAIRSTGCSPK